MCRIMRPLAGSRSRAPTSGPTTASPSSASGSGASISAARPMRSDRRCRSTACRHRVVGRRCPTPSTIRWCPASRSGRRSTCRPRRTNDWYNHYLSVDRPAAAGARRSSRRRPSSTTIAAADRVELRPAARTRRSARVTPLQVDTVGTRRKPAVDAARRGRAAADDRLRERRRAGAGARRGARAGARGPRGARLLALAARAPARHREPAALARRRRRRPRLRAGRDAPAARRRARHRSRASPRARAERCRLRVRLRRRARSPDSPSVWCRRCSTRARISKRVLRESGRGASGGRRQARFRRCSWSARLRSRWCCSSAPACCLRSFERLSRMDLGHASRRMS